ncbi:mercury resistance system transport protein MerF [Terasakiella pusilla]|jgi:mercuric ion transport protein|uniref:mercury resistance system transport protein MerF n=1 Tax=Terasakiella pusilla TaxID=64973 RepID=UPI000A07A4F3|nr:mercury resistance system transport protein MerF [Terasakiella pusilla]
MNDKSWLKTGVVGSIAMAICCFTPFLVIVLGGIGLSAWLGWIDWLLLPSLGGFVFITIIALLRLNRKRTCK